MAKAMCKTSGAWLFHCEGKAGIRSNTNKTKTKKMKASRGHREDSKCVIKAVGEYRYAYPYAYWYIVAGSGVLLPDTYY